ncbi:MAG TPA: hypothetical protein VMI31_03495 [Fimbriimonadaceae bacterium]|nr:hypothetical protein [Fimbriimonadaceae bacterium]
MRFLLLLALLTVSLAGAQGTAPVPYDSSNYRTDPRLQKPITLRLKIVPLSQCVAVLSKETGVTIDVEPSIEERKVTIVCRDKPASEAMRMLAGTFFCVWNPAGDGYRMDMPIDVRTEELRYLDAEHAVLKDRIEDVVKKMVEVASQSLDDQKAARDKLNQEIAKLRPLTDAADRKQLQELRQQYRRFDYLDWWDLGYAFRGSSDSADALASGATLFASTQAGIALPLPYSDIPPYSMRVVTKDANGKSHSEMVTPSGAFAAMRINPVTERFECKTAPTGVYPAIGSSERQLFLLNSGEAEAKLVNLPLRKRLRDWGRMLDQEMLKIKPVQPSEAPASPGYAARALTMSDQLEYLADTAGISVVCDAFRVPATGQEYAKAATVGDAIQFLRYSTLEDVRDGTFRSEKGWLMFRHPHYWRMLDSEIPESAFAPLETKAEAGKPLTLEDYANFAAALTPWQAVSFSYRPLLTRFPRLPLIHAMPALRLWAALDEGERRMAYVSGLPLAMMSPAQRDLYRLAVTELLWVGSVNEEFFPMLLGDRGGPSVKLFVQDSSNGADPYIGNVDESIDPGPLQMRSQKDIDYLKQHAYVFAFGDSPDSGSSYSFELVPTPK